MAKSGEGVIVGQETTGGESSEVSCGSQSSCSKPFSAFRLALLGVFLIGVTVADQASKVWMVALLDERGNIPIIPGLFDLTLVFNRGAAFGLFAGIENEQLRLLVLGLCAFFAFVVVLIALLNDLRHSTIGHIAMGLVLGGAVGNLIDRVRFGYVVDFLDFYLGEWHWPAFNVADMAICTGVGLLILLHFLQFFQRGRKPAA